MWNFIVQHFRDYIGSGQIFIIYVAALIFLLVKEKRKERRLLFVYLPLCILVLFFIPLFAGFFSKYSDPNTYFRILMLLPMAFTIAYALASIIEKLDGKLKIFVIIASLVVLMVSGKLVYRDVNYSKAENIYHVPEVVVDICDSIVIPGREVLAAFPSEMITFVRQYSPYVCMPYGRDDMMYEDEAGYADGFRDAVDSSEPVAEVLGQYANEAGCHYVIINEKHILQGSLSDYDFEEYAVIDGYVIYKSTTANFNLYY